MHRVLIFLLLLPNMGCMLLRNMPDLNTDRSPEISVPLPAVNRSTPTPTPDAEGDEDEERLPKDWVWVGVEGAGNQILAAAPTGETQVISLPLNDDQSTSEVLASADGSTLIYLVWSGDEQLGIAAWMLEERDARLVVQAEADERIIYMAIKEDGSQLAYVKVLEEDAPLNELSPWQVEAVSLDGGDASVVLDSLTLTSVFPPRPFAWPADGELYLSAVDPQGRSQGVFAVDPVADSSRVVKEANIDEVLVAPVLSLDQQQLAYLSYEPERLPDALQEVTPTNVVRVIDTDSGAITERFIPNPNEAVFGAAWWGESGQLLLDVSALSVEDGSRRSGDWVTARLGTEESWLRFETGPEHNLLFDFAPYGDGVVYTTRSDAGNWSLFFLPDLEAGTTDRVQLKTIQQDVGAPVILYVPN